MSSTNGKASAPSEREKPTRNKALDLEEDDDFDVPSDDEDEVRHFTQAHELDFDLFPPWFSSPFVIGRLDFSMEVMLLMMMRKKRKRMTT